MTLPELLTLYQEAVRLQDTLPDQSLALMGKILADPGCNKQLGMTVEKNKAALEARLKRAVVEGAMNALPAGPSIITEEVKPAKMRDILQVDPFAIDLIHELDGRMPISKEQFDRLRDDIKKRGIQMPLIVTPEFRLLCGYNRLKIAKELEHKSVPVVVKHLAPNQLIEFAIKDNVMRRHMSVQEVAKFISETALKTVGRPKKNAKTKTTEDVANILGVSTRTVERARSFVRKTKDKPEDVMRSIKSVVEGKEPLVRVHDSAGWTVGVDLTDDNVANFLAGFLDKVFGLDLNSGDKIKVLIQAWHVKRK